MRTVLVTGAAKRVGLGFVERFLENGWQAILHYNQSDKDALAVQAKWAEKGASVILVQADLSDRDQVISVFNDVFARYHVDCVINSASIFKYDNPKAIDDAIFGEAMQVNLHAPTKIAEAYFKHFERKGDPGCIINILDNKLFSINPDHYSYTMAKSALLAATKMMAMAYAPNMRVSGIAPGITLPVVGQSAEDYEKARAINPLGYDIKLEDLTRAAYFIAETVAFNGQILTLDAGQNLMGLQRDVSLL